MGRQMTDAVKNLLIINVLIFIGMVTIGSNNEPFMTWFALYFPKNPSFQPWQILTHMFMHGDIMHILFNMFALWMFGTAVEQVFGWKKFIIFYLLAGFGAATLQIAFSYYQYNTGLATLMEAGISQSSIIELLSTGQYDQNWSMVLGDIDKAKDFAGSFISPMVGASGAIMGILVAYGMLYPNSELMLIFLPIPIKAKYFIPGIILLDLISGLTGQSFFSPSNTAYMAHVGGALTGFLLMYFWKKNEKDKYRWN
ncbi:rhomboid family intramembrane serine protease [uncultured Winogradskyella sp.]|uniref:rhomboid family intramembrane serine protease n=3 Tax=uncultured Winogradskyella sp. TaxID=395353 RepID=UPI00261F6F4B|nr:rhomboid family intramembrane serine protease [uncultured Winogradskyella sp.]|tara:strand:- start:26082 stop:26843 length:762 start_codon:yes stop_codon:yes gene_type:complete